MRIGKVNGLWQPLVETGREIKNRLRPASNIGLHLCITACDEFGNPTEKTRRYKSHSWTKQAAQMFNMIFLGPTSSENLKETDATFTTLALTGDISCQSAIDVVTFGVVLGTGSGAESADNFQLTTPIAAGIAAGQLTYSTNIGTIPPVGIVGGHRTTLERITNNESGGSIVVTEVGLVWSNPATVFWMGIRDLLAVSETITHKTGRIWQYQFDFMN